MPQMFSICFSCCIPQQFDLFKMGTSLESVNALKSRALEVTNGITSLARPGLPSWENAYRSAIVAITASNTIASWKHSICNAVKLKANRKDDSAQTAFAGPETDARIQQQKDRLTGLRFRGEEECSHASYDITLTMLEKDCLIYPGPEQFPTRRSELMQEEAKQGQQGDIN